VSFRFSSGSYRPEADVADRLYPYLDGSGNQVGWRYVTSEDESELYTMQGRLSSIANRRGQTHTLIYGDPGSDRPTEVRDDDGRSLQFFYVGAYVKLLDHVVLPDASQVSYSYDTFDNLKTVQYPGGSTKQYHYEVPDNYARNLLTGITDESGKRYVSWEYN